VAGGRNTQFGVLRPGRAGIWPAALPASA